MRTISFQILLLFIFYKQLDCAKILVYSFPIGHSHMKYFGRLADVLVDAGHDVTVLLIGHNPKMNRTGTELAKVIRWQKHTFQPLFKVDTKKAWEGHGFINTINVFKGAKDTVSRLCEELLTDENFIKQLRAEKFELGICELFARCAYALFRKIDIVNYVTGLSFNIQEGLTDPVGVSNNPSFVPASYSHFLDTMSYTERFFNFFLYIGMQIFTHLVMIQKEEKIRELSPKYNSLMEAIGQTSFLFVNSDELLDFPRFVSQKIIFIGGIARQSVKPLENEYQAMMSKATDGAVLISFGSIAKSSEMSSHLKEAFVHVFKSMPNIKFIWKNDDEKDATIIAPNVIKKSWVPQNDLLNHPNLRAFITHCGLNSLIESVYAGIPVICIPLFGDQLRNAKIIEKRGVGISLNKMTLDSKTLLTSLQDVLNNEKYRKSARKLKQMIAEKPFTPRELFLRNVEFALKFGPLRHLDIASNNLNIFQYYSLDIIMPLFVFSLLLIFLLIKFMTIICRKLPEKASKLKIKQN